MSQPDPDASPETSSAADQPGLGKLIDKKETAKASRQRRPPPNPKHAHDQQQQARVADHDHGIDRSEDHQGDPARDHTRASESAGSRDHAIDPYRDDARDPQHDGAGDPAIDRSLDTAEDHSIQQAPGQDDHPHGTAPGTDTNTVGLDWSALNPVDNSGAAWAAAARKSRERAQRWTEQLRQARSNGATPDQLRDLIHRSAVRGRVEPRAIPEDVWTAAGLQPPK